VRENLESLLQAYTIYDAAEVIEKIFGTFFIEISLRRGRKPNAIVIVNEKATLLVFRPKMVGLITNQ